MEPDSTAKRNRNYTIIILGFFILLLIVVAAVLLQRLTTSDTSVAEITCYKCNSSSGKCEENTISGDDPSCPSGSSAIKGVCEISCQESEKTITCYRCGTSGCVDERVTGVNPVCPTGTKTTKADCESSCQQPTTTTNNTTTSQTDTTTTSSCSAAGASCESRGCCSGLSCQGASGSRACQVNNNGTCGANGAVCGGTTEGFLSFVCTSLTNGQCLQNPQTHGTYAAAAARANANGCGQVDEVWFGGTCSRQLCGDFTIFSSGCTSNTTTVTPPNDTVTTVTPPEETDTTTVTPPLPETALISDEIDRVLVAFVMLALGYALLRSKLLNELLYNLAGQQPLGANQSKEFSQSKYQKKVLERVDASKK